MPTLYKMTEELLALEEEFLGRGGDISDEELDAFLKLQEDIVLKLDRTAAFVRELELRAENRRDEANRLMRLARSDEMLAQRLRERMMAAMNAMGISGIDTPRFRLAIVTAGGKRSVLLRVEDPSELPERFRKVIVKADLEALRMALEDGDPEAFQVAELAERKKYLSIK